MSDTYREFKPKELTGPLRCTLQSIYNWIKSGKLESVRVGGGHRVIIRDPKVAELIDAAPAKAA